MSTITLSKKETYGNLINRIAEKHCLYPIDHKVKVGDGGTEYMWSDRYPYSVCSVDYNWRNKGYEIIGVQQDHAKRTDNNGMSESQTYEFTPNIEAPVRWNMKSNRWNKGGRAVTLGRREKYWDPSF